MDAKPKPMMPEIKPEVNTVDDGGKKKATGLIGGLFGSGGTGAAGGLGGLGAGAAGGGGLLATKAGMLALVIVGSSVAGGIVTSAIMKAIEQQEAQGRKVRELEEKQQLARLQRSHGGKPKAE